MPRGDLRVSNTEEERLLFWAGRKAAFPAVGRISPDYYCMDGTIPRAKLPLVLRACARCPSTTGCGSPTCSTPATATCIRSFCMMPTSRASSNKPRRSAPKS